MNRACAIFLVAIVSVFIGCEMVPVDTRQTEVTFIDDVSKYLLDNPNVKLQKMPLTRNLIGQKRYKMGERIPGDELIIQESDREEFPSSKDIKTLLTYPKDGNGSTLSCVDIVVEQSSSVGDGYVVDGGIDMRFIKVLIEANSTLYFGYVATFYGY